MELKNILHKITSLSDAPEPYVLKSLVDNLRVPQTTLEKQPDLADAKIEELISLLQSHPHYAQGLGVFILTLLDKHQQLALFTDTGILSDQGFYTSLTRLINHRFIPLLPEDDSIIELTAYLFDDKNDEDWLARVDTSLWLTLIGLIQIDDDHEGLVANAKNNILNAMVILSYRINGIGLHPDLMKAYPKMLDYSASFVAQNQETVQFANAYREEHDLDRHHDLTPEQDIDPAPLFVMIEQCDDVVNSVRKRIYKTGISIRLTNMLLRLEQSLRQLHILTEMTSSDHQVRNKAVLAFAGILITSAKKRYSIRGLISKNTQLLSRKVTENSGRVGEHYISTDKKGYQQMFKKAAIGGFVIAFMATLKILSYDLDLAPMGRAFVNSMIYGLGFVFIHIIHGTVATKQPAMTAAAIASTISDSSAKKSRQLAKLSELIIDITRTQFVAIMGNVLLAMPIAFIISLVWMQVSGTPMIGFDKADSLMQDLNPFTSLAIFHAAIAGVFLFLAGLIAGYYDNLALFNQIGDRISHHKWLVKLLPAERSQRLGTFIEANLGAIMGNFLFGVFLGSTATFGYIFGLPLDIRHIAFSSANFAHGIFNISADSFSLGLILISLLGVAIIGIINLAVSFSLTLMVAFRAKNVRFYEWKNLTSLILSHLATHPRDFFWPRPEPMQYSSIDKHGFMIYDHGDKTEKQKPLPKNFAVRRLSEVKVLPEDMKVEVKNNTKIDDDTNSPHPIEATIESDSDELVVEPNDISREAKKPLPKPDKSPSLPD